MYSQLHGVAFRKIGIAFLLSFLMVASILFYAILSKYQSDEAELELRRYTEEAGTLSEALAELHRSFGYGGFIHNFKNFILRADTDYAARAEVDLRNAEEALRKLEAMVCNMGLPGQTLRPSAIRSLSIHACLRLHEESVRESRPRASMRS